MEDGMDSGYSVWRMVAATTVSFSVSVSLSASLSRSPNLALALALYPALLAFSKRGDSTEDSISPCFALQPLPSVKHTHTRFLFRSFFLSLSYMCLVLPTSHTCALSFLLVTCSSHQVRGCTVDGMVLV